MGRQLPVAAAVLVTKQELVSEMALLSKGFSLSVAESSKDSRSKPQQRGKITSSCWNLCVFTDVYGQLCGETLRPSSEVAVQKDEKCSHHHLVFHFFQIAGMKNCCLNGKCQHSRRQNLMEISNISEEASPVFIYHEKNLDLKMVCTQSLEKQIALCISLGNLRQ